MSEIDVDGLVERLLDMGGGDHAVATCHEAADAIATLSAALATERAAHAETKRERDEALKALEQIAVIEPVSNCDAGSMARSRMRDIARYSIARRPK